MKNCAAEKSAGFQQPVNFNGSARDFFDASLSATSLVWTVQWQSDTTTVSTLIAAGVTNGSFTIPTVGTFATSGRYRIELVATDSTARKATNSVEIFPAATAQANDWSSYYPFSSNATDASNRYNGTLVSGASIALDASRGSVANLAGGSQHVSLPAGAATANTISGWVKWNGGNAWQRIFDFGVDTTRWLFLTAKDNLGFYRCSITADSAHYTRTIQAPTAFPLNQWVHVAVMFDGKQGVLYTNGQPAAINNSVNLWPGDIEATKVYLGRSQFPADAFFNGRLDAVRLNSRSLSPYEFVAPTATILTPLASLRYAGGDVIAFTGRATDYAEMPLTATGYNWAVEFLQDSAVANLIGAWSGVTNGSFSVPTTSPNSTNVLYRIRFTATDTNGFQQNAVLEVPPQLVQVALASVPSGLGLQFEAEPLLTPTNITTVAGMVRNLTAPTPQTFVGSNYDFVLWSDGGVAAHSITVPLTNSGYTASFVAPEVALNPAGTNLVISWPEWASSLQLMATTNLAPPVTWLEVTNMPAPNGNLRFVQIPMSEAQQFFRLQTP